jgi:hypothetical protein
MLPPGGSAEAGGGDAANAAKVQRVKTKAQIVMDFIEPPTKYLIP